MRLSVTRSKNSTSLYVIKSTYENGIRSTKVVEGLGTLEELKQKLGEQDPMEWAKAYIDELNQKEKENRQEVIVKYSPAKTIAKDEQRSYNGGYLFLQQIYYELGLDKIANAITKKYNFSYDLNSILSRLIYGRIIFPSSKLATWEFSKKLVEPSSFELHHVYRALEIISKESDFIQSEVYKNSLKMGERNCAMLYYDCTNYYFEIEQEEGLKRYGKSKEHRPNPITQMGMFMDGDGIPLAFSIHKGNTNEQITLKPLEKKILSDFGLSKFVVCTDAGLASADNRKYNSMGDRAFITTQSVKKLKAVLKEWALEKKGWLLCGETETYDISQVDEEKYMDAIFYKEHWIDEDGLRQRLVVTYSLKYKNYQSKIRSSQIERARKTMINDPSKLKKVNQNDYKRFIKQTNCTADGEVAKKKIYSIDSDLIANEEMFDGFYAVCTNLVDEVATIIKINKRRWELEESFRIMKSEFKARPVFLSRDERIEAHFTTCFIALIIYRMLEKKLNDKYTCHEIITCLRDMNFIEIKGEGYIPTYTRSNLTDDLHDAFGFRTDYQIVTKRQMKKIFQLSKTRNALLTP